MRAYRMHGREDLRLDAVGEDVSTVAVGDRVTVEPLMRHARSPMPHYNLGLEVVYYGAMADGLLADYIKPGDRMGVCDFQTFSRRVQAMAERPKLFVCHGDDQGPKVHPCRRVQEALREASIEYDKVIGGHGHPIPFLRKGSRDEVRAETGAEKLPALKLPDGTVLTHSREILRWVKQQG